MWYNNNRPAEVQAPTRRQKWSLRFMILIGFAGMVFFLWGVFQEEHISHRPLYYVLMASLVFLCLKIAYEWYHYFSIAVPEPPQRKTDFSVDVLTTFCPGEPYEMIIQTLEAIQQIEYPHTTYLCDEANDPYLVAECKRLGVKHVTRNNRINAKAGNINNALKQASGDICLILDPDHIPAPDFLDKVLPYFEDEEVGFVQAVQAYYNLQENIIAKGSAQQTFQFYGPIMMTMHSYGTAQAIGANCCFRRKALDSIGGHMPGLAEDMNTSMNLHAKGWKSVYVPRVLNRGLVPSTISAYYKQQLKWSRGVFELLVTTYVRHFWKFSLRQKLHYGLLPWHYFSGAIYLINFLVPILSLLLGVMPMKINLAYFFLLGMPFFASTLIIRHYVQRWVMEEDERGFHMTGGILLIGTWWIHLLGFFFTILRRKVPYNPTPKDGKEENILGLNLPNLAIGALSLFAIVYGLSRDFNPYNLAMAGFALLNTGFVLIMLLVSYQNRYREYKKTSPIADKLAIFIWQYKRLFWLFRHRLYGWVRVAALPLILLLIGGLFYYATSKDMTEIQPPETPELQTSRYVGLYAPGTDARLSQLSTVDSLADKHQIETDLVALYLPWQPQEDSIFPSQYLQQIYARNAYPLISWEPRLLNFPHFRDSAASYMQEISAGHFDDYLAAMAEQFKALAKPLFLRFAHEPDNPGYPWHSNRPAAAQEYKAAWQYLHRFMEERGVHNIIWVYNPWKASHAGEYFPGGDYVDWLGVTALNYAASLSAANWNSFDEIYAPFHRSLIYQQYMPVMLTEFGTLTGQGSEEEWFQKAQQSIAQQYPEIKAVVFFAPSRDKRLPPQSRQPRLNWRENAQGFSAFSGFSKDVPSPLPVNAILGDSNATAARNDSFYRHLKGVNYIKGQDWQASMHPLFKNVVLEDFRQMRALNIDWVKRYGPGVYDANILGAARETGLKVVYALWIEDHLDFLRDEEELAALRESLLSAVKARKDEPVIKAWHVGNPVWHSLAGVYAQPQLGYQRQAYLQWLQQLISDIKNIDPSRPVSIELNTDAYLDDITGIFNAQIPQLDAIGINVPSGLLDSLLLRRLSALPGSVFINKMDGQQPENYPEIERGWFLRAWQDDVFKNYVSFSGLLDHRGRKKLGFRHLEEKVGEHPDLTLPRVRILRPAQIPFSGMRQNYKALLEIDNEWRLAAFDDKGFRFDWYLIKTDENGNALAMREEGSGTQLQVQIPPSPHLYRLYLLVSKKGYATSTEVALVTPVYYGSQLEELSRDQIDFIYRQNKKMPQ